MRQLLLLLSVFPASALDLSHASLTANANGPDAKTIAMLSDEIARRTQIRLANSAGTPVIRIARGSGPAEGYSIRTTASELTVSGNDARGVLFGVGRLLRELRMSRGSIAIPDNFSVTTAPKYRLRGHQLGYRPKTNSYDAWDVPMWEQYIRDLAVFGANAVELIPPRSDDADSSPHFPLPPMQMMVEMSRLLKEYGMDVWIWYPAMDKDYSDPATVEFALKEWGEVFRKLPRVDAVFVPGGDPGHTQPKYLMALLEKQTQVLHRYHPKAQMWVSPQSFSQPWLEEFLDILNRQQPAWLSGVVHGPQVRISLAKLRQLVPKRYPIRNYPDITHSRQCQFPVPDWDAAFAATEGRETINPRPIGFTKIFRETQPDTIGFITYSEGCNDDVNKAVWSALGWDPESDVHETLRQYSRYFIGDRFSDGFANGLLALERNWQGPLISNSGVYTTLQQFQAMEKQAGPHEKLNWRLQQGLYRAYYDAYIRARLLRETDLEERAMDRLRQAKSIGAAYAMQLAEETLNRVTTDPPAAEIWDSRVYDLAEALFQSIRMQLSVGRYQAISVDRGANLDTLEVPLNNRGWLTARFAEIRKLDNEKARLDAIGEILDWTNPGPGGYYDDLGNLAQQPHLIRGEDPESAVISHSYRPEYRSSWWNQAAALHDSPLRMRYDHLDRTAQYKVRIVYGGDSPTKKIRLVANDSIEVHPLMPKGVPKPVEFDVPSQATAGGTLTLTWTREPGLGDNGRGTQVSEVWLIKK